MNATKERWQTPRTAFEQFVTDRYVAACKDTGEFVVDPNAISEPSGKYYLDYNRNGILDPDEKNNKFVNCDGSSAGITDVSYWGWDLDDAPLFATRYRLFQLDKGGDHYVAYGEQWVSNRNHS